MLVVPNYIAIGHYFERHKGKAMGIATIGCGFGAIFMPPLWTFMLGYYGYSGAMFIMGSIYLNNTVAGTLFRDRREHTLHVVKRKTSLATTDQVQGIESATIFNKFERNDQPPLAITWKGKIRLTLHSMREKSNLLCNLGFLLHAFTMTSLPFSIQATVSYLPSWATEQGLNQQQTALLIMMTGVTDVIGRITFGLIFDHSLVVHRRHIVYKWLCIVFGLTTVAVCFSSSLTSFIVVSLLWGLFEAGCHGQRVTVVSDFVSPAQMADAVGVLSFFQGVGNIIAPLAPGRHAHCPFGYESV